MVELVRLSAMQSQHYTYVPITKRPFNSPFMRSASNLCIETMIKYASHLIQYRKQLHDRKRLMAIKPLWVYDTRIDKRPRRFKAWRILKCL